MVNKTTRCYELHTHRCKFYGDKRITRRWKSNIQTSGIKVLRRGFLGELVLPQLVDKVGSNVVRMDVEVAGLIGFDGSSEEWEVFEDVSKG